MDVQSDLKPEPWIVHLLGLISPILVISGNIIGGVYTSMGVVFIWIIGPFLDILLVNSQKLLLPEELGYPLEIFLWVHEIRI